MKATYDYEALDYEGKLIRGRVTADSPSAVRRRVKDMGLSPQKVELNQKMTRAFDQNKPARTQQRAPSRHAQSNAAPRDPEERLKLLQAAQSGDMTALERITLVNLGECTLEFTHDFPKKGQLRLTSADKLPMLFVEKMHSGVRVFPVGNALEFINMDVRGIIRKRLVIIDQVQRKTTIRFGWFQGGSRLSRAMDVIRRRKRAAGK